MCLKRNSAQSGFTLLEMLVAIAIFAMLGIAANSVLSVVLTNDETTKNFAARLKSLQQGFGVIERDMGQIVARTPRFLEGGRGKTVIQVGDIIPDIDGKALVFYRIGWLNPDGMLPRGSIQSVAYVLVEDRFERWYYPYPEPEIGAEPLKTIIMNNVLDADYAFFDGKSWQKTLNATKLPKAIAVEIDIEGIGKIQRKFILPKGALVDNKANNSNQNGTGNNPGNKNNNSKKGGNGNNTAAGGGNNN
ncbi:type II secretion system protein GspJ [Parashewanella spongiae]|uniref:Type II secretion system protein J n=1 Tax=Parashewanella spongiae TaxID=342950 RepID=A0A3A6UIC9_9GAMM|nr:type II secretion system minor pseudopilin GspJ [Parashewanella spongiae]MCL1077152.1 type II secretion system minor pseudopilin GspJ [Parashewanella spongiae]RJY18825.1 type II secretion system protein GspJ [Parashewanella spongiae]